MLYVIIMVTIYIRGRPGHCVSHNRDHHRGHGHIAWLVCVLRLEDSSCRGPMVNFMMGSGRVGYLHDHGLA